MCLSSQTRLLNTWASLDTKLSFPLTPARKHQPQALRSATAEVPSSPETLYPAPSPKAWRRKFVQLRRYCLIRIRGWQGHSLCFMLEFQDVPSQLVAPAAIVACCPPPCCDGDGLCTSGTASQISLPSNLPWSWQEKAPNTLWEPTWGQMGYEQ